MTVVAPPPPRFVWWKRVRAIRNAKSFSLRRTAMLLDYLMDQSRDFPKNTLVPSKFPSSPLLTPVERLLLFVQTVDRALRREANRLPEHEQWRLRDSHARTFRRLTRLLVMVLAQARTRRPLSETEYVRVYAQLTSVTLNRVRLRTHGVSDRSFKAVQGQLFTLNNLLNNLPIDDAEISALTAWAAYRSVRTIGRADQQMCEDLLKALLLWDLERIPHGLLFHSVRATYRELTTKQRLRVFAQARGEMARACGKLPPHRWLDRFGLLCALVDDAITCGAPAEATSLKELALLLLADAEPHRVLLPVHTQRQIARLRDYLETVSLDAERPDKVVVDYRPAFEFLLRSLRRTPETFELEAHFDEMRTMRPELPEFRLYRDVLVIWIARSRGWALPHDFLEQTWTTILLALEVDRENPTSMELARLAALNAYGLARQSDAIDECMMWHERTVALAIMQGAWQEVVDTLLGPTYLRYLRLQLQLLREASYLEELGKYYSRLLAREPTSGETLHGMDDVATRLTGRIGSREIASTKYALDNVRAQWNLAHIIDTESGTTIRKWAQSFRSELSRFAPDGDPLAAKWFADIETTVGRAIEVLPTAEGLEAHLLRASLARASFDIATLLRLVQGKKRLQTYPLEAHPAIWLARGAAWADEAITGLGPLHHKRVLEWVLDTRVKLQLATGPPKPGSVERLRREMAAIDRERAGSTALPSRARRSLHKTELSFCSEHSREWAQSIQSAHAIKWFLDDLRFIQDLKRFNVGQVAPQPESLDIKSETSDQYLEGDQYSPDVDDRPDGVEPPITNRFLRALEQHLRQHNAAVLEFMVQPEGRADVPWQEEAGRGLGTICFVIKPGPVGLRARPFHLDVPERLLRLAVHGNPDDSIAGEPFALKTHLHQWTVSRNGEWPATLQELSARLFTPELMAELEGVSRLYLCPHRRFFQIPLHALAIPDGSFLFQRFEINYAMKLSHVVELAKRPARKTAAGNLWMVANGYEFGQLRKLVPPGLNRWKQPGHNIESILANGAKADQVIICCHGQMDEARPGRSRLRLWNGGRMLSDDVHRWARSKDKLENSEWILAACESGSSRVTLHTAPGVGLSFVSCGATRVTSPLYEVTPRTAFKMIRYMNRARQEGRRSPFTTAVRAMFNGGQTRATWAEAAAFTSFGPFTVSQR